MTASWQPGASLATLAARARLLAQVRAFMAEHGVLEVDTPILARTSVTDPAIESIRTTCGHALQPSPEYFMKRLLAAGSGPIFQLGHVFRAGEQGRWHNPEFLMLEWYRTDCDDAALMDELDALGARLLPGFPAGRIGHDQLLSDYLGIDFRHADAERLATALTARSGRELHAAPADPAATGAAPGWLLDLAYAEACAELRGAWFVTDFPPAQAALARLRTDARGERVAARFELIVDGVELANGYHELTDAAEQRARFEQDQALRRARGQIVPAADEQLLAALEAGLPDCAGVAVGLDRVLMLQLGLPHLDAAMPFSAPRV